MDQVLEHEVSALIDKARREREESIAGQDEGPPPNRLCVMQEPSQVLVRLKVDRLGFPTLNNQRFGARFVGEVANPSDILLFHQRRKVAEAGGGGGGSSAKGGQKTTRSHALSLPVAPDAEELNVEDLVADQLGLSDKKLRLLKESDLKGALEEYVQKQNA